MFLGLQFLFYFPCFHFIIIHDRWITNLMRKVTIRLRPFANCSGMRCFSGVDRWIPLILTILPIIMTKLKKESEYLCKVISLKSCLRSRKWRWKTYPISEDLESHCSKQEWDRKKAMTRIWHSKVCGI